jgi:FtsH-binding integral membrane protein
MTSSLIGIVVELAILALVLGRQLQTRPVSSSYRLPAILAAIGAVELFSFAHSQHESAHAGTIVTAVAGSLVLAAATGALRAPTVRLWRQDGQLWRKGTWLTLALWVVSLAAHFGYDALVARGTVAGVSGASVLLYFAVSLAVQQLILSARAARLSADRSGGAASREFSRFAARP